jgi:hypothetical protein
MGATVGDGGPLIYTVPNLLSMISIAKTHSARNKTAVVKIDTRVAP